MVSVGCGVCGVGVVRGEVINVRKCVSRARLLFKFLLGMLLTNAKQKKTRRSTVLGDEKVFM